MGEVVEIYPPFMPSAPQCAECGEAHAELGVLCRTCRTSQRPVTAIFVQGTIASAIADLRREQNQNAPLSGPVAAALDKLRRLYDAAEPLLDISGRGYVDEIEGEHWAHPDPRVSLGPFPNEEAGQSALTAYWDAQAKPVVR